MSLEALDAETTATRCGPDIPLDPELREVLSAVLAPESLATFLANENIFTCSLFYDYVKTTNMLELEAKVLSKLTLPATPFLEMVEMTKIQSLWRWWRMDVIMMPLDPDLQEVLRGQLAPESLATFLVNEKILTCSLFYDYVKTSKELEAKVLAKLTPQAKPPFETAHIRGVWRYCRMEALHADPTAIRCGPDCCCNECIYLSSWYPQYLQCWNSKYGLVCYWDDSRTDSALERLMRHNANLADIKSWIRCLAVSRSVNHYSNFLKDKVQLVHLTRRW